MTRIKNLKMIDKNKKYLITCRRFTAPDGLQYDSVWGNVEVLKTQDVIGFPMRGQDSNFVVKVSGKTRALYVTGCGIESAMECEEKPTIVKEVKGEYRRDIARIYFI